MDVSELVPNICFVHLNDINPLLVAVHACSGTALSVWSSNSFGPRNLLMQILPTDTHIFPSYYPVLLHQRGPLDPPH